MDRREFFAAAGAGIIGAGASPAALAQNPAPSGGPMGADYASLLGRARDLSGAQFEPVKAELTGPFADLDYDHYRAIRPRTIPIGQPHSRFAIDLLPPGFIYQDPVTVSLVSAAGVRDIPFSTENFEFDPKLFDAEAVAAAGAGEGLAFSGFRLRYPINRVDVMDEFVIFQGASYYRAIARDTFYGLSARGLAIRTGDPRGEEFPIFRHFWIEEPLPGATSITVRALLDSPSCTGAFEFGITPGESTTMQVRCTLFPREEVAEIGVAPLTSMFLFGPQSRPGTDDFRGAVHDSEGLQMISGHGERLWRALTNPRQVQVSAFQDANPMGFGLTQRRRDFAHYQDDEALYEKRPTGWVEPVGEWGKGAVVLVEIPTEHEFSDNIVSFWRPDEALGPTEQGHEFIYTLVWCAAPPDGSPLARVVATRTGRSIHDENERIMVVDFLHERSWPAPPTVEASVSRGKLTWLTLRELPGGEFARASFQFAPGEEELLEFQLTLIGSERPESEKWLYRWTPA